MASYSSSHPPQVRGSTWIGAPAGRDVTLHCLGFIRRGRDWNFPRVFSPFWRLYYNFQPGHWVETSRQKVELGPGSCVLVPSNLFFECHSRGAADHLFIHFDWSIRNRGTDTIRAIPLDAADRELIGSLRRVTGRRQAGPEMEYLAASWLQGVLARAIRLYPKTRVLSPPVAQAVQRMEEHRGAGPSISAIARGCGLGLRTLQRAFQRDLGTSPHHYFMTLRLRDAARRLADTDDSVDAIAEETGFTDRFHFSRVFRAEHRLPPAAFRRKYSRLLGWQAR